MERVNTKKGRKIVVAVDESEESMDALSWCLSNLVTRSSNSTLILLYVKPSPIIYSQFDAKGFLFSGDVIATMERYSSALVNSVMERAEAVLKNFSNHINVEKVVRTGEAKDVICNTVETLEADTLVMGSHGYGLLKRVLLGSVSHHCAKYAKCPVVIVKHSPSN